MDKRDVFIVIGIFGFIYTISFLTVIGIESYIIIVFRYGWIYNENTLPTLLSLSIFFEVAPNSLIIALIITPIIIGIIAYLKY